jgi:hypothetical protein
MPNCTINRVHVMILIMSYRPRRRAPARIRRMCTRARVRKLLYAGRVDTGGARELRSVAPIAVMSRDGFACPNVKCMCKDCTCGDGCTCNVPDAPEPVKLSPSSSMFVHVDGHVYSWTRAAA